MPFRSTKSPTQPPANSLPTTTPIVQRHSPGDGVITLNIGGKNFQTLRSTIAQNEVLMGHLLRSEANAGETIENHAVFVDRDYKHFGTILEYLRNKADGVYIHPSVAQRLLLKKLNDSNTESGSAENNCEAVRDNETKQENKSISRTSFIELPTDSKTLTELYFESIYYNVPELTEHICCQ